MGAVVWLLWQKLFTESYLSAGRGKLMIAVIVCVAAGIAVYVVCAVLFKAVRSEGTQTKTTVRTVYWCRAEKEGDIITVSVCANGFLYNMCRAMVGTMVYASYGKLLPEDIPALLEKGDRRLTGPTMPPQGLYLNRVWYDGAPGEMMARN